MVRALRLVSAAIVLALLGLTLAVALSSPANAATSPCASWVRVVDLSSNNIHPVAWANLVKAHVAGVYIKNSEATNYVNPFWGQDTTGARKAGIPYGGYYFAQPGKTDPVAAARYFVNNGGYKGILPPALDLEVTTLKPYDTAVWALKWLQAVERFSGRRPIIYVGYYFPASQYKILAPYDLWLPAYSNGYKPVANVCAIGSPKVPAPWLGTGWQMWQFTSVATFPGVAGRQDISATMPTWSPRFTPIPRRPAPKRSESSANCA